MSDYPIVVVSSCLLGQRVRYDGAEKGVAWIAESLGARVRVIPRCPEVGAGMPVPRPPIQVVRNGERLRLQVVGEGRDVSESVEEYVQEQLIDCNATGIDGAVLKARSPSCGIRDTPHYPSYRRDESPLEIASGIWAGSLRRAFPALPMVDESELLSGEAQEEFLERVFAHWQKRKTIS